MDKPFEKKPNSSYEPSQCKNRWATLKIGKCNNAAALYFHKCKDGDALEISRYSFHWHRQEMEFKTK
ncbi:hypothetical protein MF1_09980 [Bartonella quintana]|nr:hypothetical protein MF1_09980 [Bartonella quintana]